MKITDLSRIFFPDIKFLQTHAMRFLVKHELRYKPNSDILTDAAYNRSSYDRVIAGIKSSFPERVAKERIEYDAFVKRSDCNCGNASFDDYLFSFAVNGFRADEYFLFDLPNIPLENRGDYLSDRDKAIIDKGLNSIIDRGDLANKHLAYRKATGLFKRDAVILGHRNQESKFEEFMRKYHTAVGKISLEKEGAGISLIREEDIDDYTEYYRNYICGKQVLMEELIVQSQEMRRFNPSTVNTVRVLAFSTGSGCVTPYSFVKMGRVGSFVDNAAAGGIFADVDPQTGAVVSDGADELGRRFSVHPDHGYSIEGAILPDWQEALTLVNQAMSVFCTMTYVGWDLAHTDNGWVLVEGNTAGLFLPTQVARHEGIKQDIKDIISKCVSPNTDYVLERI